MKLIVSDTGKNWNGLSEIFVVDDSKLILVSKHFPIIGEQSFSWHNRLL